MGTDLLGQDEKEQLWVRERLLPILLVFIVLVVLFVFVWQSASEAAKRDEFVGRLNRLSGNYAVTIDSMEVADRSVVVGALRHVVASPAHHSGPIEPHLIRIKSDHDVIEVCLSRDSERPNEYWVSVPRKSGCGDSSFGWPYFGGLTTDSLAPYWNRAAPISRR
jgi:hypothetical protein